MLGSERHLYRALMTQAQRRSEESAAATAVAAANAVTGGPPPPRQPVPRSPGGAGAQPPRSASSFSSLDSLMSLGMDPPVSGGLRPLGPSDRAPGSGAGLALSPADSYFAGSELTV